MICLHLVWACSRGDSLYLNGTDLRVKVLPYAGVKVPYDLNHKGHNKHKRKALLCALCGSLLFRAFCDSLLGADGFVQRVQPHFTRHFFRLLSRRRIKAAIYQVFLRQFVEEATGHGIDDFTKLLALASQGHG